MPDPLALAWGGFYPVSFLMFLAGRGLFRAFRSYSRKGIAHDFA
jgi:hypothetical protein